MSEQPKDLPQDEATQAPELGTDESVPLATADGQATAGAEPPSTPPTSEPRRRPIFLTLISLLALLLACLALAMPWLGPRLGLGESSSDPASPVIDLQRALQTTQQQVQQVDDQNQSLRQSLEQAAQARQQIRQNLGSELDNQRQALRAQLQRLEQRLNQQEERLLTLSSELDQQSGRQGRSAGWPLQESQRLLRRGAADWALQPNAEQAIVIIDQVLDLSEGQQAAGLGALRQRLESQRAELQSWQRTHGGSETNWQDLAQRLSALQPGSVTTGTALPEPQSEQPGGWTQRLGSGLSRLIRIERDDQLEPELWDQQSRDSLQMLMQQSLLLAETAHRRGDDPSAHVERLAFWLDRLHGQSEPALAWLSDLRQRLERPAPPSPGFTELSERLQRIRDAAESAS